jgi:hypothetical protein
VDPKTLRSIIASIAQDSRCDHPHGRQRISAGAWMKARDGGIRKKRAMVRIICANATTFISQAN